MIAPPTLSLLAFFFLFVSGKCKSTFGENWRHGLTEVPQAHNNVSDFRHHSRTLASFAVEFEMVSKPLSGGLRLGNTSRRQQRETIVYAAKVRVPLCCYGQLHHLDVFSKILAVGLW